MESVDNGEEEETKMEVVTAAAPQTRKSGRKSTATKSVETVETVESAGEDNVEDDVKNPAPVEIIHQIKQIRKQHKKRIIV